MKRWHEHVSVQMVSRRWRDLEARLLVHRPVTPVAQGKIKPRPARFLSRAVRRRCSAGFTILEVAVAVTVLGVALVALASMIEVSARGRTADFVRVKAIMLLQREAEELKETHFSSIVTTPATALADDPEYTLALEVTPITFKLKHVRVIVGWHSWTGESCTESVECLVVNSILAREVLVE